MLSIASNVATVAMMCDQRRPGEDPVLPDPQGGGLTHRAAVIGQSENVVGWLDNGTFQTSYAAANGLYQAVAPGVDVEIAIPTAANNDGTGAPGVYAISESNVSAGRLSPGAVALANLWHLGAGGAALRLAGVCKSGTGMFEMMDNDDADRLFAVDQATVAAAETAWGPIDRVLYNWYVAEAPAAHTLWESRAAPFFGINADGTDYDFASGTFEHCLIDTRAVQTGGDLGLFGPTTKVDVMYPGNFIDFSAQSTLDPAYPNYTTNAAGNALGGRVENNGAPAAQERRDFLVDAPTANAGVATISPALAVMGDYQGGAQKPGNAQVSSHPALQSKYGQTLYAQDVGFALLCAFGFAQPTRLSHVVVEETGAYADVHFTLPAGAVLSTHRKVDGLTVASPRPHQQEVMGFVLRRSGDTARSERPIFRSDLATSGGDLSAYPLAYRGDVTIQGDGSSGVVRITPVEPFENGDMLSFGTDGSYGGFILHGFEDYDAQLCLDGLRAYEPRLDDGSAFRYPGGPVVPQEVHTVAGLAGGNPAPVAPVVSRTGVFSAINGPEVGAGVTALTLVFEGEIGVQSGTGTKGIVSLSSNGLRLEADTRGGQRAVTLRMEDGGGTPLATQSLGGGTMSAAGQTMRMMLTATQDDGTGAWRMAYYLNDALVGSIFTGASTANAFFQPLQTFEAVKSNMPVAVGRVVIWAGSHAAAYSADGLLPEAAPLVTLEGDAAYWNGTGLPAGWSKGGGGTWSDL